MEPTYLTTEDYQTAKDNGISYVNVYARFYNYGWSVKDAITTPVKKRSDGLWPRYKETCKAHGISQHQFYDRIRYKGWTPEKASTARYKKVVYTRPNAKVTREVIEIAAKNGIKEKTLKQRVYVCKWEVERAMTEPTHTDKRRNS